MLSMFGVILTLAGSATGAVLFIVAWAPIAIRRADRCLTALGRSPSLWLIPAFALLSAIWSEAPAATLRAAAELGVTAGIASLTAAFVSPRAFVSAISIGLLAGAVLSLAFGRYGVDGMTGETVFLGVFASKNTMALFMSLLAIVSACLLADRGQQAVPRLLAALSFLLSIPLLLRARSAGAIVTTGASFAALLAIAAFARMRARERLLVLAGLFAVTVPIVAIVALLALNGTLGQAATEFISGVLGKDATLTGRTVLWQIALTEIAKRPFLGIGYYAFWLQGNLLAESIWRQFSIDSRMGFSFHDTFIEFAVELGWTGTTLLVVTLAQVLERIVRLALADRTWGTACLAGLVICLISRTFDEVDLPYPFAAPTYLFFVAAAYGADYARSVRNDKNQAVIARLALVSAEPHRAGP